MLIELLAAVSPDTVWAWVSAGGIYVLFLMLFACGLGLPLPEDVPLLIAGALVGAGKLDLLPTAIACWAGIMGGDTCLYWIARRYGHNVARLPLIGRHITVDRLARVEGLFGRYGIWVVAIGRMFAGIRAAMVVAAGTIRYHFAKFFIADGLAAVVSGGLFVWLGFLGGQAMVSDVERAKDWIMAGLAVAAVGGIAWWLYRRRLATSRLAVRAIDPAEPA